MGKSQTDPLCDFFHNSCYGILLRCALHSSISASPSTSSPPRRLHTNGRHGASYVSLNSSFPQHVTNNPSPRAGDSTRRRFGAHRELRNWSGSYRTCYATEAPEYRTSYATGNRTSYATGLRGESDILAFPGEFFRCPLLPTNCRDRQTSTTKRRSESPSV